MNKKIIAGILIVALGAYIGWRVYNKPHKDMGASTADVVIEAEELFAAYDADEQTANEKYLDKVIQVKGVVDNIDRPESEPAKISLRSGDEMFGVQCEMDAQTDQDLSGIEVGEEVHMKCLCSGKLMDVVLVRCVMVDK